MHRSTLKTHILPMLLAGMVGIAGIATAQNQNQNQNQNQGGLWQRLKNQAKQAGQNTAQQGSQQVQQGVSNAGNQVVGGQQTPCGSLAGGNGNGATLTNAAFNGGSTGNVASGSCGQNCFNAGPFAAAVSQMTMSQQGYWHIIRMEIQFHNATNQPIALAYHEGSMEMVDELGNAYQGAGGNPGELQGMGIDRGGQTDSQFVLGPGQTSSAMFTVARARNNTQAIGTAFNYNFTIDELQAQNGAQAIVARQYNLNFPSLAPGSSGGAFPSATPANGFVGGGGTGTPGVASSTGAAVPAANSRTATPAQRMAVRPGVAVTNATPQTAGTLNKAALTTSTAATAKPAAAAKPIPAKAKTTNTTNTTNTTTTTNR